MEAVYAKHPGPPSDPAVSPSVRILAWLASLVLVALIAFLSLAPHPVIDRWVLRLFAIARFGTPAVRQGLLDATMVWHAVFYAALTGCLYPALGKRLGQAAAMAAAVALVMELAQRLSATRTPHVVDLACSLAGVAAVSLAIRWIRR